MVYGRSYNTLNPRPILNGIYNLITTWYVWHVTMRSSSPYGGWGGGHISDRQNTWSVTMDSSSSYEGGGAHIRDQQNT
jgi:hypothetical protein